MFLMNIFINLFFAQIYNQMNFDHFYFIFHSALLM